MADGASRMMISQSSRSLVVGLLSCLFVGLAHAQSSLSARHGDTDEQAKVRPTPPAPVENDAPTPAASVQSVVEPAPSQAAASLAPPAVSAQPPAVPKDQHAPKAETAASTAAQFSEILTEMRRSRRLARLAYGSPQVLHPAYYYFPSGFEMAGSFRTGMIVGGLFLFGIGYGSDVAIAAAAPDKLLQADRQWLYVPFVGPWAALTTVRKDCGDPTTECSSNTFANFSLIGTGLFQACSALLLVPALMAKTDPHPLVGSIVPVRMGGSGHGLVAVGTF